MNILLAFLHVLLDFELFDSNSIRCVSYDLWLAPVFSYQATNTYFLILMIYLWRMFELMSIRLSKSISDFGETPKITKRQGFGGPCPI